MYPHNPTPGTRATASTFSYLPFPGADDRFGQLLIKFDTVAAGIPAGLGAANYDLHQLVLTVVYASADSLPYDPTEDPHATLDGTAADADPGRPLELHGTGFRGGFTAATFQETSPYGSRNAFASSFDENGVARDVTNNVTLGYDSRPWAIGKVFAPVDGSAQPPVYQSLEAGHVIPAYSQVRFTIDIAVPGVGAYVRQGLHDGGLWFTLSSFHSVSGPASAGFPSFFTKEHPEQQLYQDVAATLAASYSLPLRVENYTRSADGVSLTWNGSPGFRYVVEGTDDLANGSWRPLGSFTTAIPVPLEWQGSSLSTRGFYRIARTPSP